MLFRKLNRLMLLGAIVALLGGCMGEEVIVDPPCKNSLPKACYMVRGVTSGWVYNTLQGCDVVPSDAKLATSGACPSEGAAVDICDSPEPPPAAPACYAITPATCLLGNCEVEYRIADFCGVRGKKAEIVDKGYCDGTLPPRTVCDQVNNRTYYSTTLEDGGPSVDGSVLKRHQTIRFFNGQLSWFLSDIGVPGKYSCETGKLIASIDANKTFVIEFSADLSQFKFEPNQTTFQFTKQEGDPISCNAVRGQRYSTPNNSLVARPAGPPTFLDFGSTPATVTYGHNNIEETGYYDCDLGELHVHLDGKNADPLHVSVADKGASVTILGETPITLAKVSPPDLCTLEFNPVCASFDTGLRCITTPCPSHIYRTYGNRCQADAAHSSVLFDGSCGKLEAQPVGGVDAGCPAVVMPVCAKAPKNIQCITSPCESHEYKTFSNSCIASLSYADVSFDGVCTSIGIDGQLSFAQEPARLYNFDGGGGYSGPQPMPKGSSVTVNSASINGNVLTVMVGYSGCKVQPIHFNVDASGLSKSLPPQLIFNFSKDVEDLCEAYFQSTYQFDLLPISKRFSGDGKNGIAINFGKMSVLYKF